MKKILLTFALVIVNLLALAQIIVEDSSAFLDINRIRAEIFTGGLNFYDGSSGLPSFEYPKDSGKYTIFCSALWIGGKNQGNLHLAGERYRGNGRDYYPGPVMDPAFYPAEVANWNKVWKINKADIDYHIAHWNDVGYVVPQSISQWPVYANPSLAIHYYLAPFVDVDGDSAYIPAHGDYPFIRGDQAIYFIFNDSVYQHTETGGQRLGVEVHAMAYAYSTDPLLNKTIFMNYLVYNRSTRVYDSLYMGLFTDIDIGIAQDDYIGCDSTLHTYFGYNGDSIDGTGTGNSYGNNPPVQTVTLLNQSMSSFMAFNNIGGVYGMTDPEIAPDYYFLLHGKICIDSSSTTWGWHPPDTMYCTSFMYSGYPNNSTEYTETGLGNQPYDRRGIGSSGPFTFSPGQYISFDVAYITADSSFAKTNGGFPNVDNMLAIVPLIRDYFETHFPQDGHDLALGIEAEHNSDITPQFNIYPNPAGQSITFTSNLNPAKLRLDILDINGRLIQSYDCRTSKKEMDVSGFAPGVYILKISTAGQSSFLKFVKM